MRLKEKIIRSLLDFGKKHRWLIYPTLALVAVISAISNAIYWGRGNGKRVVASVTVVALLITQSLFLRSSADVSINNPENGEQATETDADIYDESADNPEVYPEEVTPENPEGATPENPEGGSAVPYEEQGGLELIDETQGDDAPVIIKYNFSVWGTNYTYDVNATHTEGNPEYYIPAVDADDVLATIYGVPKSELTEDMKAAYTVTTSTVYSESGLTTGNYANGTVNVVDGSFSPDAEGKYNFYIKVERSSVKVYYTAETDNNIEKSYTVTGTDANTSFDPLTGSFAVKITDNSSSYYGNRIGYEFAGIKIDGVSYPVTDNTEKPITITPATYRVDVLTTWTPRKIKVKFVGIGSTDPLYTEGKISCTDTGAGTSQVVSYDYDSVISALPDAAEKGWATPNAGYVFDHWIKQSGNSEIGIPEGGLSVNDLIADPSTVGTTTGDIEGLVLVGVWEYRDYVLNSTTSGCNFSADANSASNDYIINGCQYGDSISFTLSASYSDGTGDKFAILIDPTDISKLNAYGLLVTPGAEVSTGGYATYSISGTLSHATDGLVIPVTVYDTNRDNGTKTMHSNLTLVVSKRVVEIDPATVFGASDTTSNPHKQYNGDSNISVVTRAEVTNYVAADAGKVWAEFSSGANFDSVDAGTGKTVTLYDVIVNGESGVVDNYQIVTTGADKHVDVSGIGTITRYSLSVGMRIAGTDPAEINAIVKYGEANPVYELYIDPAVVAGLPSADQAQYNSSPDIFFTNVLGFNGFNYARDSVFKPAGAAYRVTPSFSSNTNYLVDTNSLYGDITVTRDAGLENTNFKKEGTLTNGYYQGLVIKPIGDYDEIRLCSDAYDDITDAASLSAANFKSSLSGLDDMTGATIYIQMRNSGTGAITSITPLSGIYNDTSGPEIKGFTVNPATLINEYPFGSYFRPQLGMNVVEITFQYEAKDSAASRLYYYFEDSNGVRIGNNEAERVMSLVPGVPDYYEATITINLDEYGQLIVYAKDTAGNSSPKSRVKLSEFDDGGDYYEWMIENTICGSPIEVTNDGNVASTVDDVWYNNLDFTTVTSDERENNGPASGINRVEYTITGDDGTVYTYTDYVPNLTVNKTMSYTFVRSFPGTETGVLAGAYTISGVLYDNAGNSVELESNPTGSFKVDALAPIITDNTPVSSGGSFISGLTYNFNVAEGAKESGLQTVALYEKVGSNLNELKVWNQPDSSEMFSLDCSYEITHNGTYVVKACDRAGNEEIYEKTIMGISSEKPEAPSISIIKGNEGRNGWYTEYQPTIKISANNTITGGIPTTADGVPFHTEYRITLPGIDVQKSFTAADVTFDMNYEGEAVIEAVNISASGVESDKATLIVKIDTVAPQVSITGSSVNGQGQLVISFEVKDVNSGVDTSKVTVNGEKVSVSDMNASGISTGSFVALAGVTYDIVAEDIAGNISDTTTFVPLDLEVSPITDITPNSALLNAKILIGTYDLADYYIAFKERSAQRYSKYNLVSITDESFGKNIVCPFNNLKSDTVYDYKIYAMTKTSQEVKSYEGSFKTASTSSTATVYGNVSYAPSLIDGLKTYPIYVSLYQGDTCVGGIEIADGSAGDYIFKNIADGTYQIVATNGTLYKTASVTIEKGGIVYPENYALAGGVNLLLSGLSTRVVIDDSSLCPAADNLDIIYDDVYRVVITADDYEVVNNGGNILITLHAEETDISEKALVESIFKEKLGKDNEIIRYISITITKTVTTAAGQVTVTEIKELPEPITLTFPLGEYAGEKVGVASLHGSSPYYDFFDWDNAKLTNTTVAIRTQYFSVYALYRKLAVEPRYYTVRWFDGDGNLMATETVEEGKAATPPEKIPTKKANDKYTFEFDKWDTDYSCITEDTDILALFKAIPIEPAPTTEQPTTEQPTTEQPTTEQPTTEQPTTEQPTTEQPAPPADIEEPTTEPGGVVPAGPKTGDMTPIGVISILMLLSVCGMVIIYKSKKDE